MSLGERCDEIVRLIDETFADLGIEAGGDEDGHGASVTALAPATAPGSDGSRRVPRALEKPRRAASGF
ncbi:MAG TPA: hypothetical protein VMV22_15075 [Acidimicrobiales bacterium]|nr:hypothetical protein [Acidimicrobiales bacterium]